jgi:hypothetical protein
MKTACDCRLTTCRARQKIACKNTYNPLTPVSELYKLAGRIVLR